MGWKVGGLTSAEEEGLAAELRRVDCLHEGALEPGEEARDTLHIGQGLLVRDETEEEALRHEEGLRRGAPGGACRRRCVTGAVLAKVRVAGGNR